MVAIREIVERLERIVDSGPPVSFGALQDRPLEPVRIANVMDTCSKIGWKPAISLDAGLRTTVEWYKEHRTEFTSAAGPQQG